MKVKMLQNGPIMLETNGEAKLTQNREEKIITAQKVMLCRCGQSKNMPFCYGAHTKVNFKAPAGELEV